MSQKRYINKLRPYLEQNDIDKIISQHKEKVEKEEKRINAYLKWKADNDHSDMYENRKLIKLGKRKSYRRKKFEAWQKRKNAA